MNILILIALLTVVAAILELPILPTVTAIILAAPIVFFLIAPPPAYYTQAYFLVLLSLIGIAVLVRWGRGKEEYHLKDELLPIAGFCAAFLVFYGLCRRWPDFITMGERLRDYALLAAVIRSPIHPEEPWLSGYPLHYYAYWYRLGQMFAALLGLNVWDVYHQLQSFTYALYFALQAAVFRFAGFRWRSAFFCALFITLGSNVAGVKFWLHPEGTWWAPSRVIKGAINEFPIWSFLLGDLHPHYLGLALIPFFAALFQRVVPYLKTGSAVLVAVLYFTLLPELLIFNSNAWDVPVWAGIVAVFAAFALLAVPWRRVWQTIDQFFNPADYRRPPLKLLWLVLLVVLAYGLIAARPDMVSNTPVHFVHAPIPRSELAELAAHWGLPLFLITVSLVQLLEGALQPLFFMLLAAAVLFTKDAWLFLTVLLAANVVRTGQALLAERKHAAAFGARRWVIEALGMAALCFILLPEFVFLNDDYGGENERMNTIFKLYSASWFPLHAFAFYLTAQAWRRIVEAFGARRHWLGNRWLTPAAQLVALGLFTAFLLRTIPERTMHAPLVKPLERGLSSIEAAYPGAARTISDLSQLTPGIILEGQGKAYSNTTHVATLAGGRSYLGWGNHVGLLTKEYKEIDRRTEVTKRLYQGGECSAKKTLALKEQIAYIVVGPLEREEYGQINQGSFSCFATLIKHGQYIVYVVSEQ